MKRILLLLVAVMIVSGCASVRESEFFEHDTHYTSWSHMKFSLWGHKNPSEETMKNSVEEGWWGIGVPYSPEQ